MKRNRVRWSWALFASVLIFGVLTLVFWDFVRDAIVIPIYYLIWVGGLVTNSISQTVYLIGLVIVVAIIALSTLNRLELRGTNMSRACTDGFEDQSRYRTWLNLYTSAPANEFSQSNLAREIRNLLLATLAYQHGTNMADAERRSINGEWPLPAAVRQLIRDRELPITATPRPRLARLRRLIDRRAETTDRVTEAALEDIIQFIETQLEIVHDGNQSTSAS